VSSSEKPNRPIAESDQAFALSPNENFRLSASVPHPLAPLQSVSHLKHRSTPPRPRLIGGDDQQVATEQPVDEPKRKAAAKAGCIFRERSPALPVR